MFKKIEFSRTPCYGQCPVFDVKVSYDGTVKWNGHMHVYSLGEEEFSIPKVKIKKLEALLEEFDFRTFKYPEPDSFATDHPSCCTRVEYEDGTIKEVDHYLGHFQTVRLLDEKHTLENLEKFEKRIEQILGLKKYINPTFHIYHLRLAEREIVISAPNEEMALNLVGYTGNQYIINSIGRDTTGTVIPYIVMESYR